MLIVRSLLALGFVGAIAVAAPAPTLAQGVYIEGPGVGVDIGRPRYRDRDYRSDRSYAYDRRRFGGCRTITIERDDGSVRRVRRCD
jgi:hypothetical protein